MRITIQIFFSHWTATEVYECWTCVPLSLHSNNSERSSEIPPPSKPSRAFAKGDRGETSELTHTLALL